MTARVISLADFRRDGTRGTTGGMTPPVAPVPFKPYLTGDRALRQAEDEILRRQGWEKDGLANLEATEFRDNAGKIDGARQFIIDTPALGIAGACVKLRLAIDCGKIDTALRLIRAAHDALIAKGGDKWRAGFVVFREKMERDRPALEATLYGSGPPDYDVPPDAA